ncbi:hypothetical protein DVH24_027574 [Malus domestica]|uniref:t-SNARE coiled-coil homology domain-containing protein n=1 Tax=Malus domestica TaxID=3750 RepID=A0A498HDP4_MALDO|nr:hypothetical protein DVH24_027574 [Malus domestica]
MELQCTSSFSSFSSLSVGLSAIDTAAAFPHSLAIAFPPSYGMSVWVSGKLRMEKTREFEREVETLIHAVEKIAKLKIPLLIGIAFNEAIIEERKQGIQEIQQQISEVNEIFKDLAVLVHDKGAIII